jgi:exonuclease I
VKEYDILVERYFRRQIIVKEITEITLQDQLDAIDKLSEAEVRFCLRKNCIEMNESRRWWRWCNTQLTKELEDLKLSYKFLLKRYNRNKRKMCKLFDLQKE